MAIKWCCFSGFIRKMLFSRKTKSFDCFFPLFKEIQMLFLILHVQIDVDIATHIDIYDDGPDRRYG